MALEIVYGSPSNRTATNHLAELLAARLNAGTLYLGYPVLATADERVEVDALLVTERYGLTAYQVAESPPESVSDWQRLTEDQDRLYNVLESHLSRNEGLREGRQFAVGIETVTLLPASSTGAPAVGDAKFATVEEAVELLDLRVPLTPGIYRALEAALQRVSTIRPAKRRAGVQNADSKGATMRVIEKGIANLDFWQKKAAIETPDGPQRIRGLAGSGKTIVLALKAALLHANDPGLDIVVTFWSRALYQQFEDLITRFSFAHMDDRFDPDQLEILHAWGSRSKEGVYQRMAEALGIEPRDFASAEAAFGRNGAFEGACDELLARADELEAISPIFDVVLIDEAQDLPASFFRLVYLLTRDPKRIVWAYDELQKLDETAMAAVGQLFGTSEAGQALVNIENHGGEPRRDIVLPVCYRNTPWALATAHAIGFGIYRSGGLVQHFDAPMLWEDIGYQLNRGRLVLGAEVELERSSLSTPPYFSARLQPDDAVVLRGDFTDESAQDAWVAEQLANDLGDGELEPDDIMIVLPSAYTSKRRYARLASILTDAGINSHLVGVGSSRDEFFVKGSVAVGHIYRAKGNEAPMVYVLDAQFAGSAYNELSARNTIFTAITRSKAWVRICGWGRAMVPIAAEMDKVRANGYKLIFRIPSAEQLDEMRRIDAGADEIRQRGLLTLEELASALEQRTITLDQLSPSTRRRLEEAFNQLQITDDDS